MAAYVSNGINAVTFSAGEWTATEGSGESYSFSTLDPGGASFAPGDEISTDSPVLGDTVTYVGSYGGGFIFETSGGDNYWVGSDGPLPDGRDFSINDEDPLPVCFLEGTMVATPTGERAVETLASGDLILTAEGETRAVRWIGRQTIAAVFAAPETAFPIKVAAGTLAQNVPTRDLFLSPDHALVIDDVLVHAAALVNGVTVTRVAQPGAVFTYFHIETEDHAVILAEGAPAETFVDNVTRSRFDNFAEFEAMFGAEPADRIQEQDAPRVKAARQLPKTIRDLMDARIKALGFASERLAA